MTMSSNGSLKGKENLIFFIFHFSDFRVIESNLHEALTIVFEDPESIENHYDEHSYMRQKKCVKDLLESVRYLDEQDQEGFNTFLLQHSVSDF